MLQVLSKLLLQEGVRIKTNIRINPTILSENIKIKNKIIHILQLCTSRFIYHHIFCMLFNFLLIAFSMAINIECENLRKHSFTSMIHFVVTIFMAEKNHLTTCWFNSILSFNLLSMNSLTVLMIGYYCTDIF